MTLFEFLIFHSEYALWKPLKLTPETWPYSQAELGVEFETKYTSKRARELTEIARKSIYFSYFIEPVPEDEIVINPPYTAARDFYDLVDIFLNDMKRNIVSGDNELVTTLDIGCAKQRDDVRTRDKKLADQFLGLVWGKNTKFTHANMRYALRTALSLGKLVFENKKEYEDVTLDDWISEKDPLSKPQRLKRPKNR